MTRFIKTAEAVIEKVRDDKRYTTLFNRLFGGKDIEDSESERIEKHDEVMMNLLAYYSEADVNIMAKAFMMSKRAEGRLTAAGVKKLAEEAATYMTDKGTLYHWPATEEEAWEQLVKSVKDARKQTEDDLYAAYVDTQKQAWLDELDQRQAQIDAMPDGKRKENAQNQLNYTKSIEFKPKDSKSVFLGKRKGFSSEELVSILVRTLHLKRLYSDSPKKSLLYWYDPSQGIYTHRLYGDKSLETFALILKDAGTVKERTDIVKTMEIIDDPRIKYEKIMSREEFLACGNGVLELATGILHPFSPKYPITAKIDTCYVDWSNRPEPDYDDYKTGKPWRLSDAIKELATDGEGRAIPGKEKLLWETLKCGILGISRMRQAVFLVDDKTGHTGKSTFEEIIENVVGRTNVAQLQMKDFSDKNLLRNVEGAIVIIGDDNRENKVIEALDTINPFLDHRPIYIKILFKDQYCIIPDCFVIQSYNGRPIFDGATEAAFERLCIINFTGHVHDLADEASVAIKKPHLVGAKIEDPYITREEFKEWALWYVINHVQVGVHLTETAESKTEKEKLLVESDDISTFVENYLPQLQSKRVPMGFMYDYYSTACENDGLKPRKSSDFFRQLRSNSHFKRDWTQEKGRLKLEFDIEDAQMLVGMQRAGRFGYGYKTFFPTVTHTTGSESDKTTRLELDREETVRKVKTYNGWVFVRK